MEIIIDKEMTVRELTRVFSKVYTFLKIEVFYRGNEVSYDSFHILNEISNMKSPQNIVILPTLTICQIEQMFWEELGIQIEIFCKVGNSWLPTSLTNNWTLERQNQIAQHIFGELV